MKRFLPLALTLPFTSHAALAQPANASHSFFPSSYVTAELARVTTDLKSGGQTFDLLNINFAWGYHFHEHLTAELWASLNVSPDKDQYVSELLDQRVDAEYNSFGAFLVARTGGQLFLTGRAGLANSRFTYTADGYSDEQEDAYGFAAGIGAGLRASDEVEIKLEYMRMPDVDDPIFPDEGYETDMVSLGFNYRF